MRATLVCSLLAAIAAAAPIVDSESLQFADAEAKEQNLPLLKLKYGTWQAARYDAANDIYVFKNIRFAEPPVGELRFAVPAAPKPVEGVQKGDKGSACPQTLPGTFLGLGASLMGASSDSAFGKAMSSIGSSLMTSRWDPGNILSGGSMGEDCLFLDVYVPGKALKGQEKLPVVNWIYGGAYLLGSKDQAYDGSGIIKNSDNNVIYVAANYRLGALGFLGGDTVEKTATPNAGFHDQRAVLNWIQDNIGLVGGDKDNVSVWGESAGAGSILHQLTAYGGTQPAPFRKAVMLSPAFHTQYDRRGALEQQFKEFEEIAGCKGKGMACLRALSYEDVKMANNKYIATQPQGEFGFGPCIDGTFVRQHPSLELASGNFAKNVESIINSHVRDEASMFVVDSTRNDLDFYNVTTYDFGGDKYKVVKDAIAKKLVSPVVVGSPYKNQKERITAYTQWASFTCNNRWISEAYANKTWNLQYSHGTGTHGSDIGTAFYNPSPAGGAAAFGASLFGGSDPGMATFGPAYQSYLTSHARSGDPNAYRRQGSTIEWPKVKMGPVLSNVLNAGQDFTLIEDPTTKAEDCDFWRNAYAAMTAIGGYMAPNGIVQSSITKIDPATASANFKSS